MFSIYLNISFGNAKLQIQNQVLNLEKICTKDYLKLIFYLCHCKASSSYNKR